MSELTNPLINFDINKEIKDSEIHYDETITLIRSMNNDLLLQNMPIPSKIKAV
jgi:hypothetical protein